MNEPKMLATILNLPEGDGRPVRICHVDIPLSDEIVASIEFPWPMTLAQKEAFCFQIDHHLEYMRRYCVKAVIPAGEKVPEVIDGVAEATHENE